MLQINNNNIFSDEILCLMINLSIMHLSPSVTQKPTEDAKGNLVGKSQLGCL